jgi:hypothetical protein
MDHSAFIDEYWEFFNPLDDDDAVTMDSAQHTRAAAAVCLAVGTAIDADEQGPHGSIAGRKANMNREFDVGVKRMMTDNFSETPMYEDKMFTRRFRMPRAVFDRIYKDVSARPEFGASATLLGSLVYIPCSAWWQPYASFRMASRLMLSMNTCASASHPLMSRWPSFSVLFAICTASSMDASLLKTTCAAFSRLMQTVAFQAASVPLIASIGPGRPVPFSLTVSLRARRRSRR